MPAPGALAGGAIDRPTPGDEREDWTLDVRGWAVGQEEPVTAVEGVHDGSVLWRVPLVLDRPRVAARFPSQAGGDTVGFLALQSVLGLPARHEIEVRVVLAGGNRAPIGSIAAERAPLTTTFEPRRQPILITTFGRTGSMLLMRLLCSHPEVLSYKPHRFEQRIASYWIDALLTLSNPVSYLRGVAPQAGVDDQMWWVGTEAPMPWPLRDEPVQEWLGGEAVEALAAVSQQRIDALYEQIAATTGTGDERFFAEKSNLRVSSVAAELYPDGRELFLVRDFRDMLCSVLAFNQKRGATGFGRAQAGSDIEYVEQLGGWAASLARAWERRRDRAHLVRYEDLVQDPERALADLLEHVGVDSSAATIQGILDRLTEDVPELREHATSASAQGSVGRWRTDLDPELSDACEQAFGPALELFGYERT
ncbi:MAG: sulfotransferase family protein [Solirubrobacterales bacterium]